MFKPNQDVVVFFADQWNRGKVMKNDGHGYVLCQIERPAHLGSIADRCPDKPIVCVRADKVKPAEVS